jgi:multidrug efflux pump subunit AcrA (membrane-fusion protein)
VQGSVAQHSGNITANGNITAGNDALVSQSLTVKNNITAGGDIRAEGDVIAYYSSDRRLKDNITVLTESLNNIEQIDGIRYQWNKNATNKQAGEYDVGLIAQQVKEVLPEAVKLRKNGYYAIDYHKIIPLLVQSIKELKKENNKLKKDVRKIKDYLNIKD